MNLKHESKDEVHEIDGIVELNNPPPFWWQTLFYLSIAWSVVYGGYYLLGEGPTLKQELQAKLLKIEAQRLATRKSPEDDLKLLNAALASSEKLTEGKAIFARNCASCHAADGGGAIGPNLADSAWLHGDGSPVAILKVVRDGVAEKGMPPWGALLKSEETIAVTSFVRQLRGTSPAKPKAPQGVVISAQAGD